MSDLSAFLADGWISLCAAAGALVLLVHLKDITPSAPLARRFRFLLWLVMVFMLARVGHWGHWGWLFSALTHAAAALVPLAAVLLSEGMLRRHAPVFLKRLCIWGVAALVPLGILQIPALEFARVGALMLYQLAVFACIGWVTMRRDRASLSAEENRAVDRLALSLILILPFAATDFLRDGPVDLPVRLGGLGALVLCWLAIGAQRAGLSRSDILRSFAVVIGVAAVMTGLIAMIAALDLRATVQIGAALLAGIVLLAIWQAAVALSIEDRQLIALRHIGAATGVGPKAGFALIKQAAGAPDALQVGENDLQDMDLPALRRLFAQTPVIRADAARDEHLDWLFAQFSATHAMALSIDPLRLVILDNPSIAVADPQGTGLGAVHRMAALITARGG